MFNQPNGCDMEEIWKPVLGYEGLYEVSDHGHVRSYARKSTPGKLLKPGWKGSKKYQVVTLSKNGVSVHKKVHRLVLETFIGPCPVGQSCCHNNGDHYDNRLSNLRWDTHAANMADMVRQNSLNGTGPWQKKSVRIELETPSDGKKRFRFGVIKLTAEDVKSILDDKRNLRAIAKDYGVCPATVFRVQRASSWEQVAA